VEGKGKSGRAMEGPYGYRALQATSLIPFIVTQHHRRDMHLCGCIGVVV